MLKKRLIAWLLMFALCFYSMPVYAFAQEASDAAGDDTSISENVDATPSDTEASDSETSGAEASDDVTDESDNAETGAPDSEDSDADEGATEGTDDNDQTAPDEGNAGEDESVGVTPDEGENTDEVIGDENNNSEPAEPADPEQSAGPETLEPTEPEQPAEPTEPADPTEPEQPAEPTEPEMPETPAEPEQPTEPVTPEEPTEPEQPTQPAEPQEPVVTPEEPVVPEEPKDIPIEQVPVLPEVNQVVDALQNVAPPVVEVPVVPEISAEVQAFLAAVAELPDTVTKENLADVAALLENVLPLFTQLTEEEQESEEVAAAYMLVLALWEQCEVVKATLLLEEYPINYSENNINYELYEDGTAKVVSGKKDNYYRIIVPATVTYNDVEYRVTTIGEKAFYGQSRAKITLSEGLENIEANAFRYNYLYGQDLIIPNSVVSIGDYAFQGFNMYASEAYHINKIVLGDNLRSIGKQVFYHNPSNDMTIMDYPVEVECGTNIEFIGDWLFYAYNDVNTVSKVTVRGYKGSMDSILNTVVAFQNAGITYTMGVDTEHIKSASALQEAINEADGATTLTLDAANIPIRETIIIPEGKDITIVDNGSNVVFETADYTFSKPMFKIEKGGKLTIAATADDNIIINGAQLSNLGRLTAGVFQVDGTLVLKNGLINGGGGPKIGNGMFSGAIVLDKAGAVFDMQGGTLQGTSTDGAHSAPIVVGSGAEFNMFGGTIKDNYNMTPVYDGYSAGAVLLYGWGNDDVGGKMTMSGDATISNNTTTGVGGAVTLVGNAEFIMDGGHIIYNKSSGGNNHNGGGVCVAGRTGGMSSNFDAKGVFEMNGGSISYNEAGYGGGIYVNSNYVTLNAGEIIGNKARLTGGGVYVETPQPASVSTGAHIFNALITDNTASLMGGGLYFCPTGNAELYVNDGAAIYSNSSGGAADDFVSVASMFSSKSVLLSERMLGGGLIKWYQDGAVNETASGGWGSVLPGSVRYNASNPVLVPANTYTSNMALKSVVSDGAAALAAGQARLIISGNSATRGGGVGANGSVVLGSPGKSELSLKVNKVWDESIAEADRQPVTVQLQIAGFGLETVELNEANNWAAEFTGLPVSAKDAISVKEITTGYDVQYSEVKVDGNTLSITITNFKQKEFVDIKLIKNWVGDTEADRPLQVIFKLMVGQTLIQDVILNAENNWQETVEGLEAGLDYNVAEVAVDGYTSSEPQKEVSGNTISFTITNTKVKEPPKPEKLSVKVVKLWENDTEAERPEQVIFKLLVDGVATQDIILNAANNWQATVTELEAGHEYSVEEVAVDGYVSSTPEQTGDAKNLIFTVTNTKIKTETVDLKFVKLWENDNEANRPAQVVFKLLVDGVATQDIILNVANSWQATLTGLEADHEYAVEEVAVDGYTSSEPVRTVEDGTIVFTVTNTRTVTPPPNTPNDPGDDNPGGDDDPELPPVPTTNIEEPPVPLTETPTEEVIFDEEVPLTGMPEEDEEILLDEEVPLAKVPKTGDNLILWFFAAVASAIGALGLGRKRD